MWVGVSAFIWCALLLLPWGIWRTRERLEADAGLVQSDLHDVAVLIPARNERIQLPRTLNALQAQGVGLKVIVVDDQSEDGSADWLESLREPDSHCITSSPSASMTLQVIRGAPMPAGWSGKIWAQSQGQEELDRRLTLLLDADIALEPGTIATLRKKLDDEGLGLVSLMAELPMSGLWGNLLVPAFIYFFKLLYPFALANRRGSPIAAAAGGCILLETTRLREIGGFESMRSALIDDCTLARRVKRTGAGIWIGLTRSVSSGRNCRALGDIWHMVSRNAYTQLRYSVALLILCTVAMVVAFVVPVAALAFGNGTERVLGGLICLMMGLSYAPTLRFYGRRWLWVVGLPIAGSLYLGMTWHSAWRYWWGTRSVWRGRRYPRRS